MQNSRFPKRRARVALSVAALCLLPAAVSAAADACTTPLTSAIPARAASAPAGSAIIREVGEERGVERDAAFVRQILAGNIPSFLRRLAPVTLSGTAGSGRRVEVTLCVTPEYMAVGDERDFVRVPLGLAAAARVAARFGFLLPTPKMVDAIHEQARVLVPPSPMKPTAQMTSTAYLVAHNQTVEGQLKREHATHAALAAGQKKDLVLSNRLRAHPGRVAIYGWHRMNGKPIQPLSTVHGAEYADYSHGLRLVSQTAYVDGRPMALTEILKDRDLARIVSNEGPIDDADGLIRSYASLALR